MSKSKAKKQAEAAEKARVEAIAAAAVADSPDLDVQEELPGVAELRAAGLDEKPESRLPADAQPVDEETAAQLSGAAEALASTATLSVEELHDQPSDEDIAAFSKEGSLEFHVHARWGKRADVVKLKRIVAELEPHRERIEAEGAAAWGSLPYPSCLA